MGIRILLLHSNPHSPTNYGMNRSWIFAEVLHAVVTKLLSKHDPSVA